MARLENLLTRAGVLRARLANPRELADAEDAARVVGEFVALEHQMRWLPDAAVALRRHLTTPLDPAGAANHAFMAGLVLARWSPDGTAGALLDAARSGDVWCTRMARLNLRWLAPTQENLRLLTEAVTHPRADDPIPRHLLVDALAHQRHPDVTAPIANYLASEDDPDNRAWALISLVSLVPEPGLDVARDLAGTTGSLPVTATGLRAAYGDPAALDDLRRTYLSRGDDRHTALYWLGRIPHPDLVPLQVDGLQQPDPAVRADLVNSLVLVGSAATLRAAAGALTDPDPAVVDTATAHMAQLLGPAFDEQTWSWDTDGRLDEAGRRRLRAAAEAGLAPLADGRRYLFGRPLRPHDLLDLLYIGFLPSCAWVNLTATTGAVVSYSPHMDLLGNLESMHRLEEWHAAHGSAFLPGGWYYVGVGV